MRVAPLTSNGSLVVVVGGLAHRDTILEQLDQIGVDAQVLLEPEARDSAAAMAAAAAWTEGRDPGGLNIFVASDHHMPDAEAFRLAARRAAEGASAGRIVTLGVKPTEPSEAYGYIKPGGEGLSLVEAFVEKPDRLRAQEYIEGGYLWNSGNFIAQATLLLSELRTHAPEVEAAAKQAVAAAKGGGVAVLGPSFRDAPKISIDYALMERTQHASVLSVDFGWSDLGAWDAIAASGEGEVGGHIFEDAEGCMARAADGMIVAALGVRNLAIVAERDAVLVCDLARAQDVKKVVERLKRSSPIHADFASPEIETLKASAERFGEWMRLKALPIWSVFGQDDSGAFAELLSLEARRVSSRRRARVQARQVYVYSQAGMLGWTGPWARSVESGLRYIDSNFLRPDGLMRTLLEEDGQPANEAAFVYDQAFLLLAWATALKAGVADPGVEARAARVREALVSGAASNEGFVEQGSHPYQSNAHMHLLEAALAWMEVSDAPEWRALADRVVALARKRFIDPATGRLREFFTSDWAPASGVDGRLVEPGHQFEWAWLLVRYASSTGEQAMIDVAKTLYRRGREGVSERGRVAVDALNDDGEARTTRARLWPQTEWLKAAVILGQVDASGQEDYRADAALALRALWLYLTPTGLWRDKRLESGAFIEESAPASSFYHIMAAYRQLLEGGEVARWPS